MQRCCFDLAEVNAVELPARRSGVFTSRLVRQRKMGSQLDWRDHMMATDANVHAPRSAVATGLGHVYFLRVEPSAQNHNLDDYRYVLCEAGLLEGQSKPSYCGNRRMYRGYAYFRDSLPAEVSTLCDLVTKLNQLNFVQITVSSQADAFILFESLNNRGIPLSAIDIIKNKLLAEMERQHTQILTTLLSDGSGSSMRCAMLPSKSVSYDIFTMPLKIYQGFALKV